MAAPVYYYPFVLVSWAWGPCERPGARARTHRERERERGRERETDTCIDEC